MQANGTCCHQWECSHCMQATSKEKRSDLRGCRVVRPVCELGLRVGEGAPSVVPNVTTPKPNPSAFRPCLFSRYLPFRCELDLKRTRTNVKEIRSYIEFEILSPVLFEASPGCGFLHFGSSAGGRTATLWLCLVWAPPLHCDACSLLLGMMLRVCVCSGRVSLTTLVVCCAALFVFVLWYPPLQW